MENIIKWNQVENEINRTLGCVRVRTFSKGMVGLLAVCIWEWRAFSNVIHNGAHVCYECVVCYAMHSVSFLGSPT